MSIDALMPPSSFIGRQHELAEITQLMRDTRLLTLTGPGGSGKTRLALYAAAQLADAFLEGVRVVELVSLNEEALVPQAVASALGVPQAPGQPLAAGLERFLTPKSLLLVLDNCEHLIGACATLAEQLLRACPNLRILATSREALKVPGETAWPVPPLSLPHADAPTREDLLCFEAPQLFLERAEATLPGLALTDENAPALARICRQLDGMPLALELAAARVQVLTVEQIAARLEDSLRLLTSGSRTALPRHRTLRAALEWSYVLLCDAEQRLLARLSIFTGTFSLEAVEGICADEEIARGEVLERTGWSFDGRSGTNLPEHL
jgi:predicted ATPase